MKKQTRRQLASWLEVSSRGAVEAAIERAKEQRTGTWESTQTRAGDSVPVWGGKQKKRAPLQDYYRPRESK
jgi:hypothetical protein